MVLKRDADPGSRVGGVGAVSLSRGQPRATSAMRVQRDQGKGLPSAAIMLPIAWAGGAKT